MAGEAKKEEELKEILANEILDKIQKGEPVEYDHIRIKGNLGLSKLNLPTEHIARTELQIDECKVITSPIMITNSKFDANINFRNCIFRNPIYFKKTTFNGLALFSGAEFSEKVFFGGVTFNAPALFEEAIFSRLVLFGGATFNAPALFGEATFNEEALFSGAEFRYHALFNRAKFNGEANFEIAKFEEGLLTFKDATFIHAKSQEAACRRAKNVLEKNGDREEAGYHFYREMDGKRKQKPWYYRYLEFVFIQLVFGYGVHPWRLIAWWGITIVAFAVIYWIANGINGVTQLFDYIKFSLAIAIAPGYIATIISPGSTGYMLAPEHQAVAIIESIFGTFLWAGFIATFAKKYMR